MGKKMTSIKKRAATKKRATIRKTQRKTQLKRKLQVRRELKAKNLLRKAVTLLRKPSLEWVKLTGPNGNVYSKRVVVTLNSRPSPPIHAGPLIIGTKARGNDRKMWITTANSKGVVRWVHKH
jgi:hypothetical protein